MGRFQRADYRWILLADPPVCRAGRPISVLNNCDRLRRDQACWCRFETEPIVEDAARLGAAGALDDWLTAGDLEDRDVEDLRDAVATLSRRAGKPADDEAAAALDRMQILLRNLDRLVERGSGLIDRYADDLE